MDDLETDPFDHAVQQACKKVLAGEDLEEWDVDALAALVHVRRNETALPEGI